MDGGGAGGYLVGAEDVARDDVGLLGLGDVGSVRGKDGVTIVGVAIFGKEAYESLGGILAWKFKEKFRFFFNIQLVQASLSA